MAAQGGTVSTETGASKLQDGVRRIEEITREEFPGFAVFVHYNGPTDQLSGVSTGLAVLDPGASPHPPHQHPEEEFLIIAAGTGEIQVRDEITQVGPGAMMYTSANTLHGIVNTGKVPLTFYWSKWLGKEV